MHRKSCLNCNSTLLPYQKFCPYCGQKTNTARITFRHFFHEFIQLFVRAEKGLFRLVKGLAIAPGRTVTEYIEGKRNRYFSPFGFLALSLTIMYLLNGWIKPYEGPPEPDPFVMLRMPADTQELYKLTVKRIAWINVYGNKYINILSVIAAPYFGFFLWLFFRHRGRNVVEITIAYILLTAFSNLWATIIFSPFLALARDTGMFYPLYCLSLFAQTLYITWGLKRFFNYYSKSGYFQVLGALFLVGIIGAVILLGGLFLYVYHGEAMKVLPYL